MPEIFSLIRHAKSSWSDLTISDHDRPLNKRGKFDAPLMAKRYRMKHSLPPMILSSTAKRAFFTAKEFSKIYGMSKNDIKQDTSLYHCDENQIEEHVALLPNRIKHVLLFAHNPGITYFANNYSKINIDNVPTTGIVTFTCSTQQETWESFVDNMMLTEFIYPKMFK